MIIMKKLIAILFIFTVYIAAANQMVGGFGAPIYFTQYDQNKINEIKQVKNIDHIEVSYQINIPRLAKTANQIIQNLQGYKIVVKQFNLKSTPIIQYKTSSVIVVIYFIPLK